MNAFFAELWAQMWIRKRFWLVPMIIVLMVLSVLPIAAFSSGVIPFIPFG